MSNTDSQRLDAMRRQRDGYRNQLRKTEQQIQRVREVHHPVDVEPSETICHACSTLRGNGESLRYFPYKEWPCETIRALDGDGRG